MACKIYLSTDDNAPVVAGNDRTCIINLLQKCLIDGYGSRNPVGGWTMPFCNAARTQAVFRNDPAGTGHYLWIDHASVSQSYYYKAFAAEMASSENDLQNVFGDSSVTVTSSETIDATARPWIVLATQQWVFLLVYTRKTGNIPTNEQLHSGGYTCGFWFGDYDKSLPDDAYNSVISYLYNYNYFGSSSSSSSSASAGYFFCRNKQGSPGSKAGAAYTAHPCLGLYFGGGVSPAYNAQTGLYVCRVSFNGGDPYTLRGWLPDALCPLHSRPFGQMERVEINGTAYTAISFTMGYNTSTDYQCQLLFEVEP